MRDDSPIQYVKGVGPRRAELFATLGLNTVGDLLGYFPFRYESVHGQVEIADLHPGMTADVCGEVRRVRGRYPGFTAEIVDGTGACTLRWFQRAAGGHGLYPGAIVVASGQAREYDGRLEMVQPRIRVLPPDSHAPVTGSAGGPRLVGVYRGNERIQSPTIRRAVEAVLAQARLPIDEFVPAALLRGHGFPGRARAVREMHAPPGERAAQRARRRLAYDEFLLLELAMALRRRRQSLLREGRRLPVTPEIDRRIRARFPFALTASQNEVLDDICRDVASGRAMTRLLQGDVGSGKTVVALYACLAAVAHGRQAAIMAPTEVLAQQHHESVERYLAGSRVRRVLLRGALRPRERGEALAAIERGEIDLVVGTQALIHRDVSFRDLALVVIDEQHKFGVVQRARFRTKGLLPHYLVMTATPIPRTLAMTVFGDLDVSVIRRPPPGRGSIVTRCVTAATWPTVMSYVRGRLERGEQAYVVCPRIGEAERPGPTGVGGDSRDAGPPLLSAKGAHERLVEGPWRGLNVGLLYGSMPADRKKAAIDAFARGALHALVATTVVEVGVDVPNATIMIVEHAERFGLSQLHQLRGRVGRGPRDSLCVLIVRGGGERSAERLKVMSQTTDGFRIAEADLKQRGPGELLGTRQHGLPELRVGSLVDDFELLEAARRDAFEIVERDPRLERPDHVPLRAALLRTFGGRLALIDAA